MARPFTIETPTVQDAVGIATVHTQGWREAYGHLLPESFYDEATRQRRIAGWTRTLINPDDPLTTLIARDPGGAVVGVATVGPAEEDEQFPAVCTEQLYMLYILAEHYGTGVGQQLLDVILGDRPAQLWVARDNPRACSFYRRNGFVPDGTVKIDARLDDLAEIRMVRRSGEG